MNYRKQTLEEHRKEIEDKIQNKIGFGKFKLWKLLTGSITVLAFMSSPASAAYIAAPAVLGHVGGNLATKKEKEKIFREARRDEIKAENEGIDTYLDEDIFQNRMKIRNLKISLEKIKEKAIRGAGYTISGYAFSQGWLSPKYATIIGGLYLLHQGYDYYKTIQDINRARRDQLDINREKSGRTK